MHKPAHKSANVVLSFDIEEHDRIEAASSLTRGANAGVYAQRMEATTRTLLEILASQQRLATFYIVGEIAISHSKLVQDIAAAGHEVASHSHQHHSILRMTPQSFREDLRQSRVALEQASGQKVVGFRAPTFSIVKQTAWALDVLAEEGFAYDSSIFPVRHDRYGVPDAPRGPFIASGATASILELPPVTWRMLWQNLPVAGGGYFRLFPPFFMRRGLRQTLNMPAPLGMLYFHPWEFDPGQPKLPLKKLSKFRTYVGIAKSIPRLKRLLETYPGRRAIDVVNDLKQEALPRFKLASG
jgi:polysaccharide deacetylase family protein (PEP-CTERM system associated)